MSTTLLRAPQIFWSCDGPVLVLIRLKYRLDSDILMLVTWFNATLSIRSWIRFLTLSADEVSLAIRSNGALTLVDITWVNAGTFGPDILPYFSYWTIKKYALKFWNQPHSEAVAAYEVYRVTQKDLNDFWKMGVPAKWVKPRLQNFLCFLSIIIAKFFCARVLEAINRYTIILFFSF